MALVPAHALAAAAQISHSSRTSNHPEGLEGQRWKPRPTSRRPVQRGSPRHALPNFPPHPLNLPTGLLPPLLTAPGLDTPALPPLPFRPVASRIAVRRLQLRPPRALGSSILRPGGPLLYSPAWYPVAVLLGWGLFCCGSLLEFALFCVVVPFCFFF